MNTTITRHLLEATTTDLRSNYNEFWRDRATTVLPSRRTVDHRGSARWQDSALYSGRAVQAAANRALVGPEALALRIRCISRDLPMIPTPNNNFLQIIQGPGFVAIIQEMMHEYRLIPLDNRPHDDSRIRGYMGNSRGHWEGNTLVIDTTNFIGTDNFYGADENMHLTERLTRTGSNTILYQFTVNDPTAFTKPWSGELAFRKTDEPVFEYACHEGNYAMTDILAGARAAEKQAGQ